ncbi:unnamed protein product [Peronospora belbahrii]|uniref:glucan endo-1,3-beta-D-glucosidase n=1 Tax=Peronospora belbahrii TaxID=622444 RepID=A0AAU9L085_9STRA|nr:unnamed protein product [Peronospora belbahrii]CAH0515283.1 unnamed protein product [Peronospora belbahrii]
MKFFAPFNACIALLTIQVSANGVCYDPDHSISGTMDAESVKVDMAVIKNHGFTSVRTYISQFGSTNLGLAIDSANLGLKVALGVPYPQSDYLIQMGAALTAANSTFLAYIFVGNENLADAMEVPDEMINLIKYIKKRVPKTVKVGTVQRNTEVINYSRILGWSDLVDACDVLGVNIHPYFTPGTSAVNAIDVVKTQWATMEQTFGDKLMVTETGWPSCGKLFGNIGSAEGAEHFYRDYQAWTSSMVESFYFQMFDTPYKHQPFEKAYGILTNESADKFDLGYQ